MTTVFIEPCDVVFFRDDLPFGAPATQVGRCQFPPRPSVIAGALRSKVLASHLPDLSAFASQSNGSAVVAREIGRVEAGVLRPGTFQIIALHLGRRDEGQNAIGHFPVGRDLVAPRKAMRDTASVDIIRPSTTRRIRGDSSLDGLVPLAVVPGMEPVRGWMDPVSYSRYLAGERPDRAPVGEVEILQWDHRTGIGLDGSRRTVQQGRLFSSRGALLGPGWGFVVEVEGCSLLPTEGLLRLGGDGRMAVVSPWTGDPPDWTPARRAVNASRRFRWVLQTPAIFAGGWLPGAVRQAGDRGWLYERDGFRARLVSAAVDWPELAGGWDLVRKTRKPFRRMVPAGSVYWFEIEEGTGEDAWALFHNRSVSDERAAEGFGLVHLGGW